MKRSLLEMGEGLVEHLQDLLTGFRGREPGSPHSPASVTHPSCYRHQLPGQSPPGRFLSQYELCSKENKLRVHVSRAHQLVTVKLVPTEWDQAVSSQGLGLLSQSSK